MTQLEGYKHPCSHQIVDSNGPGIVRCPICFALAYWWEMSKEARKYEQEIRRVDVKPMVGGRESPRHEGEK